MKEFSDDNSVLYRELHTYLGKPAAFLEGKKGSLTRKDVFLMRVDHGGLPQNPKQHILSKINSGRTRATPITQVEEAAVSAVLLNNGEYSKDSITGVEVSNSRLLISNLPLGEKLHRQDIYSSSLKTPDVSFSKQDRDKMNMRKGGGEKVETGFALGLRFAQVAAGTAAGTTPGRVRLHKSRGLVFPLVREPAAESRGPSRAPEDSEAQQAAYQQYLRARTDCGEPGPRAQRRPGFPRLEYVLDSRLGFPVKRLKAHSLSSDSGLAKRDKVVSAGGVRAINSSEEPRQGACSHITWRDAETRARPLRRARSFSGARAADCWAPRGPREADSDLEEMETEVGRAEQEKGGFTIQRSKRPVRNSREGTKTGAKQGDAQSMHPTYFVNIKSKVFYHSSPR